MAGAIFKRKWEVYQQRTFLERALQFYERGYHHMIQLDPTRKEYDAGAYTGINASFILDLLAKEEAQEHTSANHSQRISQQRRERAREIRQRLISELPNLNSDKKDWWISATLAEAHVGLALSAENSRDADSHYKQAQEVLQKALIDHPPPDWEKESTTLQLASLIQLHQIDSFSTEPPQKVKGILQVLTPGHPEGIRRAFRGKVGLALSGGGLRASLFHIGVLARLAEMNLLQEVEVLSCVSGGSIIGAYYYLELRKLLQEKPDNQISREDFCHLIERLQDNFLAGIRKNIRTRVITNLGENLKMIFQPSRYSRTKRTGDLYEKHLFSRIEDGEQHQPRWLNECLIQPRIISEGVPEFETSFSPKLHNWRRQAKVPILILNATTLNTGHNWQFTATWMGEPPPDQEGNIDVNETLTRVYYGQAPEKHKDVRLGQAVAASSCVPGIFDPLVIENLYPDRTVRLVDGGVHDNQGIQGLLEQDCTFLIVSDASGQMASESDPSPGAFGTLLRTNNVLQARIRIAQHQDLVAQQQSLLLKDLIFLHLKQDLENKEVPYLGQDQIEPSKTGDQSSNRTSYGIDKTVQALLAEIRTDLDSFTDIEAYALMTSGYRMTEGATQHLLDPQMPDDHRHSWKFLSIENSVRGAHAATPPYQTLCTHLRVGRNVALKVWSLLWAISPCYRRFIYSVSTLLLALGLFFTIKFFNTNVSFTLSGTLGSLIIFLGGILVLPKILGPRIGKMVDLLRYRETLKRIAIGVAISTGGFLLAWLHLLTFDKLFLRLGGLTPEPIAASSLESHSEKQRGSEHSESGGPTEISSMESCG